MSNENLISRLNQLTIENYNYFRRCESNEVLAEVKNSLEVQFAPLDSEIDKLEIEYKALVADRNANQETRLNTMNRKAELSKKLELYKRIVADENLLILYSRQIYAAKEECKNRQIEQRQLTNEIWGEGWRNSKYYIREFV